MCKMGGASILCGNRMPDWLLRATGDDNVLGTNSCHISGEFLVVNFCEYGSESQMPHSPAFVFGAAARSQFLQL